MCISTPVAYAISIIHSDVAISITAITLIVKHCVGVIMDHNSIMCSLQMISG